MRLYFNLQQGAEMIRDEVGIEVPDTAHAKAEALKAIEEMCREQDTGQHDWAGWKLAVADDSGALVFSLYIGDHC